MKNKEFKYILLEELKKELKKDFDNINYIKIILINKLLVIYCNDRNDFANLLNKLDNEFQCKNIIIRELEEIVKK